ncbi:PDZ domain-containing protein [Alkalihalobacillus sp. LMS39]|uniref:PDZ domain-containing protein n=1 Tax=Alkalihalobacillus sp. LMS39 TaxID=2924032 RepID=UPI001FB40723|nr:PDZ domain-containing protein [Alkalihalobacillus sp. LMS39]UOE93768.1 PDZ domain-containing protein [Alkalihalobacillus sp. LMS39]
MNETILIALKALGVFFIHPLFYLGLLFAILMGIHRVKRERRDFHTRIYDFIDDLRKPLVSGIVAGICVSFLLIGLGVTLSVQTIVILGLVYVFIMTTTMVRFLSPAYVLAGTILVLLLFETFGWSLPYVSEDKASTWFVNVTILFALLLLAEGLLIRYRGYQHSSPRIEIGQRGKWIGTHLNRRLWFVPLVVLVPNGALPDFLYWPILSPVEGGGYGVMVLPFFIGFSALIRSGIPYHKVKMYGSRVIGLSLIVLAVSIASYFYTPLVIVATIIAIVGREVLYQLLKQKEEHAVSFFTLRERGVIIVGVIPGTSAEKMGLKIGETIVKVNGVPVNSPSEFYEGLQRNPAYCKLEVKDENGEVRFANTAIYDGEHYQIGVMFVKEEKAIQDSIV